MAYDNFGYFCTLDERLHSINNEYVTNGYGASSLKKICNIFYNF